MSHHLGWTGAWELKERSNWSPWLEFLGVPEAAHDAATKAPDFHRYIVTDTHFIMDHRIPAQGMELHFKAAIDGKWAKCPYPQPTATLWKDGENVAPAGGEPGQWRHQWVKQGLSFETEIVDFAGKGKTVKFVRELVGDGEMSFTVFVLDNDGSTLIGPCFTTFVQTDPELVPEVPPDDLILHYFPAAGRGELIRLIAAVGGLTLQESPASELSSEAKLEFGSPSGTPVLSHGDLKMAQSTAIERYVANIAPKYQNLTPAQRAIDATYMCIKEDMLAALVKFVFDPTKVPLAEEEVPKVCEKWFPALEAKIPEQGFINGLNFPTAADLAVINITRAWMLFGAAYAFAAYDPLAKFPKVKAFDARVAAFPEVKAYLETSKTMCADPMGFSAKAKPCLYYLPVSGRGELIRLIAAAGGVDMVERTGDDVSDKLAFGSPSGLPILQHGLLKMAQSYAIECYIADIAPTYKDAGLTPAQRAIDEMFCKIKEDVLADYAKCYFGPDPKPSPKDVIPGVNQKWFPAVESKLPESGFVHGKEVPTPADLVVLSLVKQVVPFGLGNTQAEYDVAAKHPKAAAHAERVANHPTIKAYLEKSPTFFMNPFA